jgi:hypothetical protein
MGSLLALGWMAVLSESGWVLRGGPRHGAWFTWHWGALLCSNGQMGLALRSRGSGLIRDKFEGLLKGFSPAAKELPARTVHVDDSVSRRFARGADYNLKCASPCRTQSGPPHSTRWLAIETWQGA